MALDRLLPLQQPIRPLSSSTNKKIAFALLILMLFALGYGLEGSIETFLDKGVIDTLTFTEDGQNFTNFMRVPQFANITNISFDMAIVSSINTTLSVNFEDTANDAAIFTDLWDNCANFAYTGENWTNEGNGSIRTSSGGCDSNYFANSTVLTMWFNLSSTLATSWVAITNFTGGSPHEYFCALGHRVSSNRGQLSYGYSVFDSWNTTVPFEITEKEPYQIKINVSGDYCYYYARYLETDAWTLLATNLTHYLAEGLHPATFHRFKMFGEGTPSALLIDTINITGSSQSVNISIFGNGTKIYQAPTTLGAVDDLNFSVFGDMLYSCDCENCTITNGLCSLPIEFLSESNATITISNLNVSYDWEDNTNATIESATNSEPALLSDDLYGFCNTTSPTNSTVTYSWTWYRNALHFSNGTEAGVQSGVLSNITSIGSANTFAGDNWTLSCVAQYNDINITSPIINSTNISIIAFDIDNCSTYTDLAFNITTRDEKTNLLLTTNGTFLFTFWKTGVPGSTNTYSITMNNRYNYTFCKSPADFDISGNMVHTLNADGYNQNNFNRFGTAFDGVFTPFLLEESAASTTILYNIVDSSLAKIEDALFSAYRVINGTLTLVYQGQSDVAGQVSIIQDQEYEYFINISAEGYPLKELNLKPILTTYTIKLTTEGDLLYDNAYDQFRYKITPPGTMFEVNSTSGGSCTGPHGLGCETFETYEDCANWFGEGCSWDIGFLYFTFEVDSNNIEYFGINLTDHDFECDPASCSAVGSTQNGGNVTVGIKLDHVGRFYTSLYFKKIGEQLVFINKYPNDATVYQVATRSLINLMQDIRDNTSPNVRAGIAALISVVLIGIGVSIGISGWPLFLMAILANIFLSLPMIGFINPLFGAFTTIAGGIVFVLSQRD